MKKILIPTDFSVPAENAARYGVALAKKLKADVLICNAFKVPAEAPMASQVAWPLMDYAELKQSTTSELDSWVKLLSDPSCSIEKDEFCPALTYESSVGTVSDVVLSLVKKENTDLVVMGMAGAGAVTQFVLGSNSREMIEKADFPLLLIPYEAGFKNVRKIVFATNLRQDELEPLKALSHFASLLNAGLVIAHITHNEIDPKGRRQQEIDDFFEHVISKIGYPEVKYEYVWNIDVDKGLQWIAGQTDVDMVAIAHRHHHLIHRLFAGSHTQKLSRHTKIPLLVYPTH